MIIIKTEQTKQCQEKSKASRKHKYNQLFLLNPKQHSGEIKLGLNKAQPIQHSTQSISNTSRHIKYKIVNSKVTNFNHMWNLQQWICSKNMQYHNIKEIIVQLGTSERRIQNYGRPYYITGGNIQQLSFTYIMYLFPSYF